MIVLGLGFKKHTSIPFQNLELKHTIQEQHQNW